MSAHVETSTYGVILRTQPHGDYHLAVTAFTAGFGKIRAMAFNARRSKRRFAGALGFGTVADLTLTGRLDRMALAEASPRRIVDQSSIGSIAHAAMGCELVDAMTEELARDADVLRNLMELLEQASQPRSIVMRRFELAMLRSAGVLPDLDRCTACGLMVMDGYLVPGGGLVCQSHGDRPGRIGWEALDYLRQAAAQPVSAPGADEAWPDVVAEARRHTQAMLTHHIGRPLRSVEFVARLQAKNKEAGHG